jgi:hypothetical protein
MVGDAPEEILPTKPQLAMQPEDSREPKIPEEPQVSGDSLVESQVSPDENNEIAEPAAALAITPEPVDTPTAKPGEMLEVVQSDPVPTVKPVETAITPEPQNRIEEVRLMPASPVEPQKLPNAIALDPMPGRESVSGGSLEADPLAADTQGAATPADVKILEPQANDFGDKIIAPAMLRRNAYYVQIATLSDKNKIHTVLGSYGEKYPFALVPLATDSASYQVLVGPLNVDEYGVVLARFQSSGYKDAFLKKIP